VPRLQAAAEAAEQQRQQRAGEPFNGSALEWVLRKADESLDEIEENPPEYAKVIYDVSTGPIGAFWWPGVGGLVMRCCVVGCRRAMLQG